MFSIFQLCCVLILGLVCVKILYIIYRKLMLNGANTFVCLTGRTVIITGANKGLGYRTALDFAKRGARIILGCRDLDKGLQALNAIVEASGNTNIAVKRLDLACLQSVRSFAEDVLRTEENLHVLVNNGGIYHGDDKPTKDGFHSTLQTNYLGHFLLTHLLLDLLKKSAPSRIVNVTSFAAQNGKPEVNKLQYDSRMDFTDCYYFSKQCQILFTNHLSKQIANSGVTVNAVSPGVAYSDIFQQMNPIFRQMVYMLHTMLSEVEAAQTIIYASVSNDVENMSGKYYENCVEMKVYDKLKSERLAKEIYEKTYELVELH